MREVAKEAVPALVKRKMDEVNTLSTQLDFAEKLAQERSLHFRGRVGVEAYIAQLKERIARLNLEIKKSGYSGSKYYKSSLDNYVYGYRNDSGGSVFAFDASKEGKKQQKVAIKTTKRIIAKVMRQKRKLDRGRRKARDSAGGKRINANAYVQREVRLVSRIVSEYCTRKESNVYSPITYALSAIKDGQAQIVADLGKLKKGAKLR